jgi:hypothetical protein
MTQEQESEPEDPIDLPQPSPERLPDLTQTLRQIHQSLTTIFHQEVATAGGAEAWLTSRCPLARESLATVMIDQVGVESIVLSNTQAFWVGHEARLAECARCPRDGAACADSPDRVKPGILVKLAVVENAATERWRHCERYQDYRMAERLESVGVDRRLSRVKIQRLSREPLAHVIKAFDVFIGSGEGKRAPNKQILIEGPQCREYAASLLRASMRNFQNASYRSVHVPSLEREAKNAITNKEPFPLLELAEVDVLVLDAVEPDSLKKESWFRKELIWVYERRRDQGLATIITASFPVKGAFVGVSVLRI